jgi:hypothetical protein
MAAPIASSMKESTTHAGGCPVERSYEIHIRGMPDPDLLRELPNVTAGAPQMRTVLYGHELDQAALRGLLDQLENLGLELVEVRAVPPGPPSDEER